MIGTTLSHFKIVAKLGEGGMGVVWRAKDLDLHRPVAVKILSPATLEREDMRARFMREARTAASLNHPNVCTVYEVGEHDEAPYIVMELIEGRTLEDRMRDGERLGHAELLRIALRIADGLAAAHAKGIVHRDLKPGNVMLTKDGRVKILDFGLAKPHGPALRDTSGGETITAEMTRAGTVLGTVAYMSPEQAEGKPVDPRSDVFSFGILLYQMAAGRLPFQGETTASTLAKILEAEPDPPLDSLGDTPRGLDAVVRRCLHKRPEDRYGDTRELVAALRELRTTGETGAAGAATGTAPSAPRPRAKTIWLVALLAVVAVAAAGIALIGTRLSGTSAPAESPAAISVAVLPFENLSGDEQNEYFSAGMTEEIISKLSRIDDLEVASRGSVAAYKDTRLDTQQIGAELGVRYLLEGSVRRAGDRVRISTRLVDGTTGRNVWSEDFDGNLDDVFAMQEKTAMAIAERLDLQLSPEEARDVQQRATDNVLAYDAYLKAQALLQDWGVIEKLEAAREQYARALELDPDYAPALAGLASVEAQFYRNFDSTEQRIRRAEELAARAAELDPSMTRARLTLGEIAAMRYDYQRAAVLLRDVVESDPKDPLSWDYLSWVLAYKTPPDAKGAIEAAEKALELRPDYPGAYYHLGRGLLLDGRPEEARAAFERSLELNRDFTAGHMGLAQYHLALGHRDEALAALDASGKDSVMHYYYAAAAHAAAGDTERAMDQLARAFESGFRDFAGLEASPYFEPVRDTNGYRQLVARYR